MRWGGLGELGCDSGAWGGSLGLGGWGGAKVGQVGMCAARQGRVGV